MKDIHTHVVELLPWFVNGTLSAHDRAVVEQHVGECLPCRRALRDEQTLYSVVRHGTEPSGRAEGLEKLLQSTRAPPTRRTGLTAGLAAAASVAIALGAFWAYTTYVREPGFSTLATDAPAAKHPIDVVFTDDASDADIRKFVADLGGTVVAGPSRIGRYTIALPDGSDKAALIERIRDDPLVRFAGPAFTEEHAP